MKLKSIAEISKALEHTISVYTKRESVATPDKLKEPRRSQILFLQQLLTDLSGSKDKYIQQTAYGAILVILAEINDRNGLLHQGLDKALGFDTGEKLTDLQTVEALECFTNYLNCLYVDHAPSKGLDPKNQFTGGANPLEMNYLLNIAKSARTMCKKAQDDYIVNLDSSTASDNLPAQLTPFPPELTKKVKPNIEDLKKQIQAVVDGVLAKSNVISQDKLVEPFKGWVKALTTQSDSIITTPKEVLKPEEKRTMILALVFAVKSMILNARNKDLLSGKTKQYPQHDQLTKIIGNAFPIDNPLRLEDIQAMATSLREFLLISNVTKIVDTSVQPDKSAATTAKPSPLDQSLKNILLICNALEFKCREEIMKRCTAPQQTEVAQEGAGPKSNDGPRSWLGFTNWYSSSSKHKDAKPAPADSEKAPEPSGP